MMKRTLLFCLFLSCSCMGWLSDAAEPFRFEEQDAKRLVLTEGESPILSYNFAFLEHENVPEKDRRRMAGCYVHPLYGLNGEVLTDNAPKDHYHHHGVFWTWPHVGVHQEDGSIKEYDLWMSNGDLKQHFVRWMDRKTDGDQAVFGVENGWFVGKPDDGKKIMEETVRVVVHRPETDTDGIKSRAIDFEFLWKPVGRAISLRGSEGKSYGGLSVRLRPFVKEKQKEGKPNEINVITVPSGVTDRDLPETPLAWADYTSRFGDDEKRSGMAIFVPKSHPDFPPTWLTRYYGPLCVGWPGVKDRKFEPGEEIKLRYRIWIHDAPVSKEQIERAYEKVSY